MATRAGFWCLIFGLSATAAAAQTATLKVGDKAPALAGVKWVKGDAVELPKDIGRKIYVVEFWATWCPPCKASVPLLTDIQKRFKDDVVILGLTAPDPRNTEAMVEKFVRDQGPAMEYTVGVDVNGSAHTAYMEAAQAMGIPHAFIVGKDGKIAWQGSPLEPDMAEVLEGLVSGRYDPVLREKINKKLGELTPQLRAGNWPGVVEGLKEVLQMDPSHTMAMSALLSVYTEQMKDPDGLRSWADAFLEQHQADAYVQFVLAQGLIEMAGSPEIAARHPDLAIKAAQGAYQASKGKPQPQMTAAYAAALFHVGALDRAIAIQTEAVQHAGDSGRSSHQAVLDYYLKCKRVRDAVTQ
jgi:thiol-disulfide isomerase/thioredoxin